MEQVGVEERKAMGLARPGVTEAPCAFQGEGKLKMARAEEIEICLCCQRRTCLEDSNERFARKNNEVEEEVR